MADTSRGSIAGAQSVPALGDVRDRDLKAFWNGLPDKFSPGDEPRILELIDQLVTVERTIHALAVCTACVSRGMGAAAIWQRMSEAAGMIRAAGRADGPAASGRRPAVDAHLRDAFRALKGAGDETPARMRDLTTGLTAIFRPPGSEAEAKCAYYIMYELLGAKAGPAARDLLAWLQGDYASAYLLAAQADYEHFHNGPVPVRERLHDDILNDPQGARLHKKYAARHFDILKTTGREAEAEEFGRKWFELTGRDDPRLLKRIVQALLAEQRIEEARALLAERGATLDADAFNLFQGRIDMADGRLGDARERIDKVLDTAPSNATAIRLKVRLSNLQGSPREGFDLAKSSYEKGHIKDPALVLGQGVRAGVPASELCAMAEGLVARHRQNLGLLREYYRLLLIEKRYPDALAAARRAKEIAPDRDWVWIAVARMLSRLEDHAGKAQLAGEIRAEERLASHVRGRVLAILHLYEEAERCLEEAVRESDTDFEILDVLAELKVRRGDYKGVRPFLDAARLNNPRLAASAVALAQAHAALGRDPAGSADLKPLVGTLVPAERLYRPRDGHVLHLGGSLVTGGAERQMVLTATQTARHAPDWTAEIACNVLRDHGNGLYDMLVESGIAMLELRSPEHHSRLRQLMVADHRHIEAVRRIGALPPTLSSDVMLCYAAIVDRAPEVVHCWQDGLNLCGGLAAVAAGVPRVVLTGRRSIRAEKKAEQPELASFLGGLLARPDVTLWCNSRYGADSYAGWLGLDPDEVGVIPNGYDFARIDRHAAQAETREALRERLGFDDSHIVLGNVARLVPFKRQDLWLRTLARLMESDSRVRGVLVGGGMLEMNLKTLAAELGIADRVHFAGEQTPVEPWIAAMDLFLYTASADGDGLPNVLIEAQALGCPVASPQAGGALETFVDGQTGLALSGDGPDAWAGQIAPMLARPGALREMGTAARAHVRARFDVSTMVQTSQRAWAHRSQDRT